MTTREVYGGEKMLPDGLVTREEAARIAGVHINTIRNWEKTGRVMPKRVSIGARVYIGIPVEELTDTRPSHDRDWRQS